MLVDCVDVVHPDGHPHALIAGFITIRPESHLDRALASTTLSVLAEENLAIPGANTPKSRRTAPLPTLLPSELLEPREALSDIGDVQDRVQSLGLHALILLIRTKSIDWALS